MRAFLKKIFLIPGRLKYKTMVAFTLMSLIPLLICAWLVTNYIFPNIDAFLGLSLGNISLILFISIVIAILGLYITKQMIDPLVKIARDAKGIAEGDTERVIEVNREDEIGDISKFLNVMTKKIRNNIEELKVCGEETRLINIEINKKVLALSGLLQIGELITSASELSVVLNFVAEKVSDVEGGSVSFVMLLEEDVNEFKVISSCNSDEDKLRRLRIKEDEAVPYIVIVDNNTTSKSPIAERIVGSLGLKNIAVLPMVVSKKLHGILVVGNAKDGFVFRDDEKELLKIFAKQTTIALENNLLIRKARDLTIKDDLTGLYNENYIHSRLDEEIRRAAVYQRCCGYLLIDMDDFKSVHEQFGEVKTEALLRALAEIIKCSVMEVDKVGYLRDDRFAVILPERNKKQVASIAEDIRKKIEENLGKIMKTPRRLTVSIGVSENPIDGSSASELMQKAAKLLKSAKILGKNRVVV